MPFPAHAGNEPTSGPQGTDPMLPFPAHAGMNRTPTGPTGPPNTVHRTRGDEPTVDTWYHVAAVRSPHTRG